MIVRNPRELPRFDQDEMLTIDVETTSFDDNIEGTNPFKGHRIVGVAVCTMDGKNSWYVPMRHRLDPHDNIYLPIAKRWLKDVVESGRDIVNHFIKFDARFWHFEDCEAKGRLIDTAVMARLWKSNLRNLGLNYLSGGLKDKSVKGFLKSIRSKDFGRVPVSIMGPYAENDVIQTAKLFRKFRKEMRSECTDVWNTEISLTKHLVREEINGIKIDVVNIKKVYRDLLRRMLQLQDEINEMAGCEVDCNSPKALSYVLTSVMGFKPLRYTDKGNPQWNRASLSLLKHPIGLKIQEFTHLAWFTSTFCEGWLDKVDSDGRLHPNFTQAAARTGRMASKDPCVTNLPIEAETFILPDDDCAILGGDYSQIEYRIFAHYAKDPEILKQYQVNANTDYHQMLADLLGVPRNFAKSLNFSFLYGMGKKTLLHTIAGILALSQDVTTMADKLRSFGLISGHSFARNVEDMDFKDFEAIANGIYTQYHRRIPSMKQLNNRVQNAIRVRGWLKNYKGRIYEVYPSDAYKGVNLLIQGSAADIFKDRLNAVLEEFAGQLRMITNIYDSLYFNVPLDSLYKIYPKFIKILEDFDLRVPLRITPSVGKRSLGTCVKVGSIEKLPEALEKSLTFVPEFRRKTIRPNDIIPYADLES